MSINFLLTTQIASPYVDMLTWLEIGFNFQLQIIQNLLSLSSIWLTTGKSVEYNKALLDRQVKL